MVHCKYSGFRSFGDPLNLIYFCSMHQTIDTIVWDWNGTLLDDTDICLEGINQLLKRRALPVLELSRYRQIFTFPVRSYYEAAGFDFSREAFEIPAGEFIAEYGQLLSRAELFPDVPQVLSHFRENNYRQFILSAMEQGSLEDAVRERGILPYFERVAGISDHLAYSKLLRGKDMFKENRIDAASTILVGDTLHDLEVAVGLNTGIALVGRGHQHHDRLQGKGHPVLENLLQLKKLLKGRDL